MIDPRAIFRGNFCTYEVSGQRTSEIEVIKRDHMIGPDEMVTQLIVDRSDVAGLIAALQFTAGIQAYPGSDPYQRIGNG